MGERLTSKAPTGWHVHRHQSGITLLESLLGLMLCITMISLLAGTIQQHRHRANNRETATQFKKVSDAAWHYVLDHWQPLTNTNRSPSPTFRSIEINVEAELIQKNYLSLSTALKNPYQQTYRVQLLELNPKKKNSAAQNSQQTRWHLQVTTHDGQVIPQQAWQQIAPQIEAHSKVLPMTAYTDATNRLITRGYQLPDVQLQALNLAPTAGHLAAYYPLEPPAMGNIDNFLYRKKIPGRPTLNQMQTDLHLQQYKINLAHGLVKTVIDPQRWLFENQQTTIQIGVDEKRAVDKFTSKKLQIALRDGAEGSSCIATPTQITLKAQPPVSTRPTPTSRLRPYSGSQLHLYWNKLPVLLSENIADGDIQEFANQQCADARGDTSELFKKVGRLFIIVTKDNKSGTAYICGKKTKGKRFTGYAYPLLTIALPDTHLPIPQEVKNNPFKKKEIIGIVLPESINLKVKGHEDVISFTRSITKKIDSIRFIIKKIIQMCKEHNLKLSPEASLKKIGRNFFIKRYIENKKIENLEETLDFAITQLSGYYRKSGQFIKDPESHKGHDSHQILLESMYKEIFPILMQCNDKNFVEIYNGGGKQKKSTALYFNAIKNFKHFKGYMHQDIIKNIIIKTVQTDFSRSQHIKFRYMPGSLIGIKFPKEVGNEKQAKQLLLFLTNLKKFNDVEDLESDNYFIDTIFTATLGTTNFSSDNFTTDHYTKFKECYNKKANNEGVLRSALEKLEDIDISYELLINLLPALTDQNDHPLMLRVADESGVEVVQPIPHQASTQGSHAPKSHYQNNFPIIRGWEQESQQNESPYKTDNVNLPEMRDFHPSLESTENFSTTLSEQGEDPHASKDETSQPPIDSGDELFGSPVAPEDEGFESCIESEDEGFESCIESEDEGFESCIESEEGENDSDEEGENDSDEE